MTAATITTVISMNDPGKEVVVLTFTDGETYVCKKFGSIVAAQATLNEDTGALTYPVSLAISAETVTIHCEGVTDKKVCLTLYGKR